jgi:Flp pilus assembly pilin Flp
MRDRAIARRSRRGVRAWRTRQARTWRSEAGQTVTEYLMILGILTAIIAALTKMIVPAISRGVLLLLDHMVVFVSTPPAG